MVIFRLWLCNCGNVAGLFIDSCGVISRWILGDFAVMVLSFLGDGVVFLGWLYSDFWPVLGQFRGCDGLVPRQ